MNQNRYAVVVTTINPPTSAVIDIARGAPALDARFYLIGDSRSPAGFVQDGATYLDVAAQRATGLRFAEACPVKHYARKNIGYLVAMRDGADVIIETDDDNIPIDGFWTPRRREMSGVLVDRPGWCNVYRYYSDMNIWPRGLPLDRVKDGVKPRAELAQVTADCPIQQGLADGDPDVDAIYRLVLPLPVTFSGDPVVLGEGVWCPFNSQNTTFFKPAFPLLYLPYHCSFRMTDIWRSFVAQRIGWANGWSVGFHAPTVFQERNDHDLMRDFAEEVPGYLHNERIRRVLEDLPLSGKAAAIGDDVMMAYRALIAMGVVGTDEEALLGAWLEDLATLVA